MEIKQRLKQLIADNKIDEALKLLMEQSAEGREGLEDIVISLSNRYRRFRDKSLKGLESREQELSQIVHDTLEVVNSLDTQAAARPATATTPAAKAAAPVHSHATPPTPSTPAKKNFVMIGIAVLVLILVLWFFIGPGDDGDYMTENLPTTETPAPGDNPEEETMQEATAPEVAGLWQQFEQNLSATNDCAECYIEIQRIDENMISVSGSNGYTAGMRYNNEENEYEGIIDWHGLWGENVSTTNGYLYMEDGNLVLETEISGQEYIIKFRR